MTEPPEYRPVQYPASPYTPGVPGGMNEVGTTMHRMVRPPVVVVAFVLWLLAAFAWPLGGMLKGLAADGSPSRQWVVFNIFLTVCVVSAVLWPAVRYLQGSFQARVALCGLAGLSEILAIAFFVAAVRDGANEELVLQLLRIVLPLIAVVLSFLPGSRGFFAANLS